MRLNYIAEGDGETLIFVPGWLMPAEIWRPQIDHFARKYRVIALDPRSQGDSEVAASGNHIQRRADDLHELIEHLQAKRVVLIGWSLGVLEALMYVGSTATKAGGAGAGRQLRGRDAGAERGPGHPLRAAAQLAARHGDFRADAFQFTAAAGLPGLATQQVLRTPPKVGASLLAIPYPRTYWRSALYETRKPVFYAVTHSLQGQAVTLAASARKRRSRYFPARATRFSWTSTSASMPAWTNSLA